MVNDAARRPEVVMFIGCVKGVICQLEIGYILKKTHIFQLNLFKYICKSSGLCLPNEARRDDDMANSDCVKYSTVTLHAICDQLNAKGVYCAWLIFWSRCAEPPSD